MKQDDSGKESAAVDGWWAYFGPRRVQNTPLMRKTNSWIQSRSLEAQPQISSEQLDRLYCR
jgi:hypothetical protein